MATDRKVRDLVLPAAAMDGTYEGLAYGIGLSPIEEKYESQGTVDLELCRKSAVLLFTGVGIRLLQTLLKLLGTSCAGWIVSTSQIRVGPYPCVRSFISRTNDVFHVSFNVPFAFLPSGIHGMATVNW